ncbi:MAG TPA: hypothetical protein VGF71_06380 [Caulobacteraceae bacterium]|jgi:bifunctional DNA-binding transcriptional regulator/antitoxin component of YhaV-PrlF toxin-antitoxin module
MSAIQAHMSPTGRLTVPKSARAKAGLARGGPVVIEIVDGDLRVRSIAQAMARARTLAAEIAAEASVGDVNAFLAERRREAASEP